MSRRARASTPARTARHDAHLFTRPFIACFAFRVVNALVVRTFFNADEFWQGPEVAHRIAYGYGFLTWEWRKRLRGYLHPLVYAAVYRAGDAIGIRGDAWSRNAPRLTHAALAAWHDVGCYRLAMRLFGADAANWALKLRTLNWFVFFCETRSFSNCMEGCFVTWALTYWPTETLGGASRGARKRRLKALFFAAMACAVRPTSAVVFLGLGLWTLMNRRDGWVAKCRFVAFEVAPTACVALALTAGVDRYFYGEWTFVPWNFIKFNVLGGGSAIYGAHPWHWYLSQGYPAVMGTMLPLTLAGFWRHRATKPDPFIVTFWTLLGYSLPAHKEFRFILPCVGASIASAASAMSSMSEKRRRAMMIFLVVTNVPAALYASVWHQAGTISAMKHIATIAKSETITHGGVLLATPCHQTPYYSHVHSEIRLTFLECDPRGADSADSTALDDSASFAADPDAFLSAAYGASPLNATTDATTCVIASSLAPSRVLLFDADARRSARWLSAWRFVLEKSFHHAHFEVDRELQREVYLYKRDDVDVDDACRAHVPAA